MIDCLTSIELNPRTLGLLLRMFDYFIYAKIYGKPTTSLYFLVH